MPTRAFWKSRPLCSGSRTSRTRQPGASAVDSSEIPPAKRRAAPPGQPTATDPRSHREPVRRRRRRRRSASRMVQAWAASLCDARVLGHKGQRELEDRAVRGIWPRADPAAMRFDDRPADREPHAESTRLRRVERLEHSGLRIRSRALRPSRGPRTCTPCRHRSKRDVDPHLAGTALDLTRRFDRIEDQVQHDLLQLNAISRNGRQLFREARLERHPGPLQLMANHRDHVTDNLVEVDGRDAQRLALDQRADAVDDGAGTGARLHDALERPLRPLQVRRLGGEPARAGRGAA